MAYAARKDMPVNEVERWLGPILNYGAIRRSGGIERPLARPDECLAFS